MYLPYVFELVFVGMHSFVSHMHYRFMLIERECISAADHILFFPLGGMDGGVTLLHC